MKYMKMEMLISKEKAIEIMNGDLDEKVSLAKFGINGLNIVIEVQKDCDGDVDCEFVFSLEKCEESHFPWWDISQCDLTNEDLLYKVIRSELIEYFDIYYNVPTKLGDLFTECCTILICEDWYDKVGVDMLDVYKSSLLDYETITTMLDEMNKTNCKIEDLSKLFKCKVLDNGTSINYSYISAFVVYENEKLVISDVYDLETHDPNDNSIVYDVNIRLEEIKYRIELLERLRE